MSHLGYDRETGVAARVQPAGDRKGKEEDRVGMVQGGPGPAAFTWGQVGALESV